MGETEKLNKKIIIMIIVLIVGSVTLAKVTNSPYLVAPFFVIVWLLIVGLIGKYLSMIFKNDDKENGTKK